MKNIDELLQQFFASKTKQLLAASDEAISEHSGLKGSHREDLIKLYFSDVLPRRFEIGKGMVYGRCHKSKEADIVIWDSYNYPKIQMQGHSLLFAESVKMVFEVKTIFNNDTLNDILKKSKSVIDIVPMKGTNLEDAMEILQGQITSLITGERFEGFLKSNHHIATGAIAFKGGKEFSINNISGATLDAIDESWPDIMILLEAGKVILKKYDETENGLATYLECFDAGENALLLFTVYLLGLLSERIINIEADFYMVQYVYRILDNISSSERVAFRPTRPSPGRKFIWG